MILTRVSSRSEVTFGGPARADEQKNAQESDDDQSRGVELQDVSFDVAEIHFLVNGNTHYHSGEDQCIETWHETPSQVTQN